jgi:hypothetical protein
MNCVVNATGHILLRFYIFKGYEIQLCKLGTYMAMQTKAWMTSFVFKEFLSFSKRSIPGGISLINRHLLILDVHNSHVTLEAIKQAHELGLNMVTLPTHTSHALRPFDVSCFKSFKTTYRKEKNVVMSKSNYMELDEITLNGWVDQALDKSIMEQNIRFGFRVTNIYPLNPRAMDNKTEPSNIYKMVTNEHGGEEEESNDQLEGDESRIEYFVATDLRIHMTEEQITVEECNASRRLEAECDYVDMPPNLTKVDDMVKEINIENISNTKGEDMANDWEEVEFHELGHQEEQELLSLTQESMKIHNLLSLSHFLTN